MFWRTKSPIDPDDEDWLLACWSWLLSNFGGPEALRARRLVMPTTDFFARPSKSGHGAAREVFDQTVRHFGLDPAQFHLVAQAEGINPILGPMQVVANPPRDPAGTFSVADGGSLQITYQPELVARPTQLVATFAHEICHPLLLSVETPPPGGEEMEEFATDLAVTFFGFGIFNLNTAAMFRQFSDTGTGTQGWSIERQGYLSPAERALALALFISGRAKDERDARRFLDQGPSAYFSRAVKYLAANPRIAEAV